jgi:outer membrane protein insertion porin family
VKERQKFHRSNGGVSGIAGTFVGSIIHQQIFGPWRTLSLTPRWQPPGQRSLGFTEPYFLNRPLQLGFVVYLRRFDYNQGAKLRF